MPIAMDVPRSALGPYAPASRDVADALQVLVRQMATDTAPQLVSAADDGQDLDLKTTVTKLEPDTEQRPFASVQIHVEVQDRATKQPIYTRKVESEVRRLIQAPTPMDDARFARTAMGRAATSCLRSLFTAVADTFAGS